MKPFLQRLANIADCFVFCYPNAGLPNAMGGYDETPAEMAADIRDFAKDGLLNLAGGCCGSTRRARWRGHAAIRSAYWTERVERVGRALSWHAAASARAPHAPSPAMWLSCITPPRGTDGRRRAADGLDAARVGDSAAVVTVDVFPRFCAA